MVILGLFEPLMTYYGRYRPVFELHVAYFKGISAVIAFDYDPE